MHPIERHWATGHNDAVAAFGLEKIAILSQAQKDQMLAAHRAKPKGMAAIQAQATPPILGSAPAQMASATPGPASLAQMQNPATPPILPGSSGLELAAPKQFGYGTAGLMPGAQMGARGQVVGLPNKLAAVI